MHKLWAFCLALLAGSTHAAALTDVTLDNGMRVIVHEDHRAPVMVSQVWYRAGAVDEFNGTTGAFVGTLIGTAGLGSVGITDPSDMEIGPDGHLYISNHISTPTASVWKFNITTGAFMGTFASVGATNPGRWAIRKPSRPVCWAACWATRKPSADEAV